jgi:hypothetical protein
MTREDDEVPAWFEDNFVRGRAVCKDSKITNNICLRACNRIGRSCPGRHTS